MARWWARAAPAVLFALLAVSLVDRESRIGGRVLPEVVARHPFTRFAAEKAGPYLRGELGLLGGGGGAKACCHGEPGEARAAAEPAGEAPVRGSTGPSGASPFAPTSLTSPTIPDCCCAGEDVERFSRREFLPLLDGIVRTPFFQYFKVDLRCECPFWPDDAMCSLRDCSVCECEEGEVPRGWIEEETAPGAGDAEEATPGGGDVEGTGAEPRAPAAPLPSCESTERESDVDRTLPPSVLTHLKAIPDWRGWHNPWMPAPGGAVEGAAGGPRRSGASGLRGREARGEEGDEEEEEDDDEDEGGSESDEEGSASRSPARPPYSYINLLRNPERYTGYKGEPANRIWATVYAAPALALRDRDPEPARRALYRLVSGLHASISAHLVAEYLLDEATDAWGPNLAMFYERLGRPDVQDRVENLQFAYLFVLRALAEAEPSLRGARLETGDAAGDAEAEATLARLLDAARAWAGATCGVAAGGDANAPPPLFFSPDLPVPSADVVGSLRQTFQNLTLVLDCVGCEKCKLWGKLQFLGLATSLKILLPDPATGPEGVARAGSPTRRHVLERNELIALVNLAERLANSIEIVRTLREAVASEGVGRLQDKLRDAEGVARAHEKSPLERRAEKAVA